jgi:hypothetical protein
MYTVNDGIDEMPPRPQRRFQAELGPKRIPMKLEV